MTAKKLNLKILEPLLVVSPYNLWAEGATNRLYSEYIDFLLIPRVWVGLILCILGIFLLKRMKLNKAVRLICLVLIFFLFGIVPILPLGWFSNGMSIRPSPMCAATKPFLFYLYKGFVPSFFLMFLAYIGIVSLIGKKLFCGWTCPLGALQEIALYIKLPKGWKRTIPFVVSNVIRIAIFIAFFLFIFLGGVSIYSYFNPFHLFHWQFALYTMVVSLITLVVATFIFRPFCT